MIPKSLGLFTPLVMAASLALSPAPTAAADPPSDRALATNVILLIDDGAGYNHHLAGSLYDTGLPNAEAYDDFPFRFGVSTYSYGDIPADGACPATTVGYDPEQAWTDFDYPTLYPTDSAAAATAIATGVKTYDAAIGVDCDRSPLRNIVQSVESLGKSTGVVTSVPFDHATPAGFVAHNPDRDDYIGIGREMILSSATDVIMGGGHPWFNASGRRQTIPRWTYIDQETWDALRAGTAGGDADGDADPDPFTLVETRAAFQALATGDTPDRVFGMAPVRKTLQQERSGNALAAPFVVPLTQTVPTLSEMAAGALNVLDDDPQGFFLMVEGGATDYASHDNQQGRMLEEELAFDRMVDTVLNWVDAHSNWGETLLIVTSDHETGYLTGPGSGWTPDGPAWYPLVNNGAGVVPGMEYQLVDHTNSLVPLYAKGDAGRVLRGMATGSDPVRGRYIDNTDIHTLMLRALGVTE